MRISPCIRAAQAARGLYPIVEIIRRLDGRVHRVTVQRWLAAGRVRGERVRGVQYIELASVLAHAACAPAPAALPAAPAQDAGG